jgi:hypothetical protein
MTSSLLITSAEQCSVPLRKSFVFGVTLVLNVACRVMEFCTLPKGSESVDLLLTVYLRQGKTVPLSDGEVCLSYS